MQRRESREDLGKSRTRIFILENGGFGPGHGGGVEVQRNYGKITYLC